MIPLLPRDRREDLVRRAVAELRRSWREGYTNIANVKGDQGLDALRDHREFRDRLLDIWRNNWLNLCRIGVGLFPL
jgi:hypothetical protein